MPAAAPGVGDELVGREAELARLRDLADLSVEHGAQLALVTGEAGIGKTTMTSAFVRSLAESGWGAHVGHSIEYADRTLPLGPIIAIVSSVLRGDADDTDALVGPHRADLAALLPELDWGDQGVDAGSDVGRLFDAITHLLIAAARRRPLVLVVEDIHWADAATRDVLSSLVHTLRDARVLILVTERAGATSRDHPLRGWIAEMRRLVNAHALELSGLTRGELEEQATRLLDEHPDPALIDDLVERTGGNPYFSRELVLTRQSGGMALPVSLVEFLTARVNRLEADERELLRALAVVGGVADHRLLAAMLPDLDVSRLLRSLFDASILEVSGNELAFGHALLREAILREVLPFEAEDLHRSAAEAIEADPRRGESLSDLTSLAVHWSNAGDHDRSLAAAVRAAEAAAAVAASEAAAELSLQALHEWPAAGDPEALTGTTRLELLTDTADRLAACLRSTEALAMVDEALAGWARQLRPAERALLLAWKAPVHWHMGNPDETARLLVEAEQLVDDDVSAAAAQVHHRISKQALADGLVTPALAAAERAISIAESEGPEVALVEAMTAKALAVGVTSDLDAGVELARDARATALRQHLVPQVANAFRTEMLIIVFQAGRTEDSLEVSRQALAYAELHCGPRWRAELQLDLCFGYLDAGRYAEAETLLDQLLETELEDLASLTVLQSSAVHALGIGDLDRAATHLDRADEIADRYQSSQETGFQARLRSELARRRARPDEALHHVDIALELHLSGDNLTYTREAIVEKLRVLRLRRDSGLDDPPEVVDDIAAQVEGFDDDGVANRAMRAQMDLELAALRGDVDVEQGEAAAEALEAVGYLHEAAQALLLVAERLASTNDDAEPVVRRLADLTAQHGMTVLAERTRSLAAVSRIDLTDGEVDQTPATDGAPAPLPLQLTPREVEVMALVAEGLTNKAIGERLFLSHRTVSTHISNLLAKLGVANRGEAAAAFHRLGLAEVIDLRDSEQASESRAG
ncbi:MAG: AAA family ATPase [Actinomycetota bacterium]